MTFLEPGILERISGQRIVVDQDGIENMVEIQVAVSQKEERRLKLLQNNDITPPFNDHRDRSIRLNEIIGAKNNIQKY